jgi:hypothetical protein
VASSLCARILVGVGEKGIRLGRSVSEAMGKLPELASPVGADGGFGRDGFESFADGSERYERGEENVDLEVGCETRVS